MQLTIDLFSDLHLSHNASFNFLGDAQNTDDVIAINAGDTTNGDLALRARLTAALCGRYKTVLTVDGNHDWYGFSAAEVDISSFENVIDGFKIVGCSLWTNFRNNPLVELQAQREINDFHVIKRMTPHRMKELHSDAREFLLQHKDADIVVTHFPPLIQSEHEQYRGDTLNGYFVNDDPDLVRAIKPLLWCHGHTHMPFDYDFEGTRVVCNPRGYPHEYGRRKGAYAPKRIVVEK